MAKQKPNRTTYFISGNQLCDPCGEPVTIRGINKLIVFDQNDPLGNQTLAEIAKTGANSCRLAWGMAKPVFDPITGAKKIKATKTVDLNKIISNCKKNKMIPIIGLWDFTDESDGGFSKLQQYLDYWKRPAIVKLIKKHENALIINIANEAAGGDENNQADIDVFADTYIDAVAQLRAAGINVPLLINGMDRGKSLICFTNAGQKMLNADPLHNLLFSYHTYWPKWATQGSSFIEDSINDALLAGIPFIMGEISKFGAWPGFELNQDGTPKLDINGNNIVKCLCGPESEVEYMRFLTKAHQHNIGYLVWEWGPGNGDWRAEGLYCPCPNMDATTDGTYLSLENIPNGASNEWLKEVIITDPNSIKNTSVKSFYQNSGFKWCKV
jgi:mannan endo-1,4-beta-mannosidase